MPIRADSNEQQKPIDRFIGGIATAIKGQESVV